MSSLFARTGHPRPPWITELPTPQGCGQPARTPVPQLSTAPRLFAFGLTRSRLPKAQQIEQPKRGHFNLGQKGTFQFGVDSPCPLTRAPRPASSTETRTAERNLYSYCHVNSLKGFRVGRVLWRRFGPCGWFELARQDGWRMLVTLVRNTRLRCHAPICCGFTPSRTGDDHHSASKKWNRIPPMTASWSFRRKPQGWPAKATTSAIAATLTGKPADATARALTTFGTGNCK